jgi:uridine phosphorylase
MARRQREGCVVVEMEAAAFFAVARFRRVELAQILYERLAQMFSMRRGFRVFEAIREVCASVSKPVNVVMASSLSSNGRGVDAGAPRG